MSTPFADAAAAARQADSEQRRRSVLKALAAMVASNEILNASSLARRAGVSRAFIYRHDDLRARLKEAQIGPRTECSKEWSGAVTAASLMAELAHERAQVKGLRAKVRTLERRISELTGEQVMAETGLVEDETTTLRARVDELSTENAILHQQLDERADELAAARRVRRAQ